ncbi:MULTISPECIES: hypothetical protein [unclassified Phaeobacter]
MPVLCAPPAIKPTHAEVEARIQRAERFLTSLRQARDALEAAPFRR